MQICKDDKKELHRDADCVFSSKEVFDSMYLGNTIPMNKINRNNALNKFVKHATENPHKHEPSEVANKITMVIKE